MNWLKQNWKWLVTNLAALAWFGNLLVQAVQSDFTGRAFGHLVGETGTAAMVVLILALAMTPLQIVLGWHGGQQIKKSIGLWAFAFGLLHFFFYVVEKGVTLAAFSDFFILIGLAPLLIMAPLAITSTAWWMRKLGTWWKPLHRTVYAAGMTAGIHTAMAGSPLLVLLMAMMLVVRIPVIRRWFVERRQRPSRVPLSAQRPVSSLRSTSATN